MTGTHIIANADAQQCYKDVQKFIDKKEGATTHYSTTVVATGMVRSQMNLTVITSCLIFWECSEAEWQTFQAYLKLSINGTGIPA